MAMEGDKNLTEYHHEEPEGHEDWASGKQIA
jgi:hypothetical protein